MPTPFADTINVQRGTVGGAGGDDTYLLSSSLIDANAEIVITDSSGTNTIQLIDGLTITSSIVASDTMQITLSNGAVITVLGASSFQYETGGNPLSGVSGDVQGYSNFAISTLGTTVPSDGTSEGGEVTVGDGETDEEQTVSADIGTMTSPETLTATGAAFTFTDDANVENHVVIGGFSDNDLLQISNASTADYTFANDGDDVSIVYNNTDSGVVNMVTLTGVVSADDLVFDQASFETAIGFNAFQLV